MAASAATTSFQKRNFNQQLLIPGTKPSLTNNQLLISTGIPSLDNFLGGGLAVGTVLLIEEDLHGLYSTVMLKYFLSEGCVNKNELFIASNDISPESILHELPQLVSYDVQQKSSVTQSVMTGEADGLSGHDSTSATDRKTAENNLAIAWRYQNLKIDNSTGGASFGHFFDLTKTIPADVLATISSTLFTTSSLNSCDRLHNETLSPSYRELLQAVERRVSDGLFSTTVQVQQRNILLLGVHSLASPQWGRSTDPLATCFDVSLLRFLYALRSILRSSYAACVITVPTHLYQAYVSRIRNLCDVVIRLESFTDTPIAQHVVYKEYHGLFHIIKTPRLNSLTNQSRDTSDLVFKLRRKRFTIEKLHLPPALQDESDASQKSSQVLDEPNLTSMGCGTSSSKNSKLDF